MNLRWRCRYEFWMCMTLGTKLRNSRDFIPIAVKLKQISGFQTTKPNQINFIRLDVQLEITSYALETDQPTVACRLNCKQSVGQPNFLSRAGLIEVLEIIVPVRCTKQTRYLHIFLKNFCSEKDILMIQQIFYLQSVEIRMFKGYTFRQFSLGQVQCGSKFKFSILEYSTVKSDQLLETTN